MMEAWPAKPGRDGPEVLLVQPGVPPQAVQSILLTVRLCSFHVLREPGACTKQVYSGLRDLRATSERPEGPGSQNAGHFGGFGQAACWASAGDSTSSPLVRGSLLSTQKRQFPFFPLGKQQFTCISQSILTSLVISCGGINCVSLSADY